MVLVRQLDILIHRARQFNRKTEKTDRFKDKQMVRQIDKTDEQMEMKDEYIDGSLDIYFWQTEKTDRHIYR